MLKEKHSNALKFILFLSVLLFVSFTGEAILGTPRSDFYFIVQKIIVFILSLIISGALLAFLSKITIKLIIGINIILVACLFFI